MGESVVVGCKEHGNGFMENGKCLVCEDEFTMERERQEAEMYDKSPEGLHERLCEVEHRLGLR